MKEPGRIAKQLSSDCHAKGSQSGTIFQLTGEPIDCINLKLLLNTWLIDDLGSFVSTKFMNLEHIIIRSIYMDYSTKAVELAGVYTGTITLIEDILTVSDVRVGLSFVSRRSQKFTFDIRGTFSVGSVPIDMRLIRNEEGR